MINILFLLARYQYQVYRWDSVVSEVFFALQVNKIKPIFYHGCAYIICLVVMRKNLVLARARIFPI
jgi:hypothetical protein